MKRTAPTRQQFALQQMLPRVKLEQLIVQQQHGARLTSRDETYVSLILSLECCWLALDRSNHVLQLCLEFYLDTRRLSDADIKLTLCAVFQQGLRHLEPQRTSLTRRLPRNLQALRRASAVKYDRVEYGQVVPKQMVHRVLAKKQVFTEDAVWWVLTLPDDEEGGDAVVADGCEPHIEWLDLSGLQEEVVHKRSDRSLDEPWTALG